VVEKFGMMSDKIDDVKKENSLDDKEKENLYKDQLIEMFEGIIKGNCVETNASSTSLKDNTIMEIFALVKGLIGASFLYLKKTNDELKIMKDYAMKLMEASNKKNNELKEKIEELENEHIKEIDIRRDAITKLRKENDELKKDIKTWKKDALGFRKHHNILTDLIKGCDTDEKLEMLKQLNKVEQ
jgi:hypothetical protein